MSHASNLPVQLIALQELISDYEAKRRSLLEREQDLLRRKQRDDKRIWKARYERRMCNRVLDGLRTELDGIQWMISVDQKRNEQSVKEQG